MLIDVRLTDVTNSSIGCQSPSTLPDWSTSLNQSSKQNKYLYCPISQANKTLVIVHRDHPPPAYRTPRLPAVNSIIGYGRSITT